jgi:hypothetical protein
MFLIPFAAAATRRGLVLVAVLAAGAGVRCSTASASPLFQIAGNMDYTAYNNYNGAVINHINYADYTQTSSSPLSNGAVTTYADDNRSQNFQVLTTADGLGLHSRAGGTYQKTYVSTGDFSENLSSSGRIFSTYTMNAYNPTGSTDPKSTSFHLHLGGYLGAETASLGVFSSASLVMSASVPAANQFSQFGNANLSINYDKSITGYSTGLLSGFVAGVPQSRDIVVGPFTVPGNTDFTVRLLLGTDAGVVIRGDTAALGLAVSSFENTLSFATDRPVFDLPAGYTVNSADAGIYNNMFVVPEPILLTPLTLAALAAFNRRRKMR